MVLVAVTGLFILRYGALVAVHRRGDAHCHVGRVNGYPSLGAAPRARHRAGVQPLDSRRTHIHVVVLHLLDDPRSRGRARDGAWETALPGARSVSYQAARADRRCGSCSSSSRQTQRRHSRAPGPPPYVGQSDPVRFSWNPKHWVWSMEEWHTVPVGWRGRFSIPRPDPAGVNMDPAAGPIAGLPVVTMMRFRRSRCLAPARSRT